MQGDGDRRNPAATQPLSTDHLLPMDLPNSGEDRGEGAQSGGLPKDLGSPVSPSSDGSTLMRQMSTLVDQTVLQALGNKLELGQVGYALCPICQNIFEHWHELPTAFSGPKKFPYYPTASSMMSTAELGCLLCGQILRMLEAQADLSQEVAIRELGVDFLEGGPPAASWQMELECNAAGLHLPLRIRISAWTSAEYTNVPRSFASCKDPRNLLPLVNIWLQDCLSHTKCHVPPEAFLPTRLIYVGEPLPRLVLSEEIDGFPKYCTLSHCWGKLILTKLSTRNLESFKTVLPPDSLSQTFADAIEVARFLNIKYLWIDSLCIIQDSKEDWAKESSQMTKVYSLSAVNIAATAGSDGSKGLFEIRDESRNNSFVTVAKDKGSGIVCHCVPFSLLDDTIWTAPLNRRGWVFQERLMPSRTIHFGAGQIFWECNDMTACETFPAGLPHFLKSYSGEFRFDKKPIAECSWRDVIGYYSHCHLTVTTDKLVAVSGLARAMHKTVQEDYLAGFWEDDNFIGDLCWETSPHQNLMPRPLEYRAPSWSWASVDSVVVMECASYVESELDAESEPQSRLQQLSNRGLHVRLIDKEVELAGTDPYGAISHASLLLLCDVLYPMDYETLGSTGFTIRWDFAESSPRLRCGLVCLLPMVSELEHQSDPGSHMLDLSSRGLIKNMTGLILKRTESESRGEYQRIGRFSTPERDELDDSDDDDDPVLPESAYQEMRYEAPGGKRRYTIMLI